MGVEGWLDESESENKSTAEAHDREGAKRERTAWPVCPLHLVGGCWLCFKIVLYLHCIATSPD